MEKEDTTTVNSPTIACGGWGCGWTIIAIGIVAYMPQIIELLKAVYGK